MNQKEILFLSITIFLTILAWIFMDLYKIKTKVPEQPETTLQTVDFKLDTKVLETLRIKRE